MIKYGVWNVVLKVWCIGKYPYLCNEDGSSSFNTYDINFAFKYRENIAERFPDYSYEVRERI